MESLAMEQCVMDMENYYEVGETEDDDIHTLDSKVLYGEKVEGEEKTWTMFFCWCKTSSLAITCKWGDLDISSNGKKRQRSTFWVYVAGNEPRCVVGAYRPDCEQFDQ